MPPNFGLPGLMPPSLQFAAPKKKALDSMTPEQLAKLFEPFDEQERMPQSQMAEAQAQQQRISPRHSTGLGGAFGALASGLNGAVGGYKQAQAQSASDLLLKRKGEADAGKFSLMQEIAAQKAAREDALAREKMAQKDREEAAALAEWNRRNAITSAQSDRRAEMMAGRQIAAEGRKDDAKAKAGVQEIEERYSAINSNLAKMEKLIQEGGTFDFTGSHNAVLKGAVNDFATDMAKLKDKDSAAREGEVELEAQALFRPGAGALFTPNKTALELIQNSRERVKQRRDEAYRVRGITPPGAPQSANGLNLGASGAGVGLTPEEQAEFEQLKKELGAE